MDRIVIILVLFCVIKSWVSQVPIKEKYDKLTNEESPLYYFEEPDGVQEHSNFGEGLSKILDGYLIMFNLTQDKGYLYRFAIESLKIMGNRNNYHFTSPDNEPRWTPFASSSTYLDGYIILPQVFTVLLSPRKIK